MIPCAWLSRKSHWGMSRKLMLPWIWSITLLVEDGGVGIVSGPGQDADATGGRTMGGTLKLKGVLVNPVFPAWSFPAAQKFADR